MPEAAADLQCVLRPLQSIARCDLSSMWRPWQTAGVKGLQAVRIMRHMLLATMNDLIACEPGVATNDSVS